ncbi:hypothetical protein BDN72DRAFT_859576 [Pluteus cervinus]|uniref:Uncharacterized protein n=1 Tax=Pluteus cervinus TaxID=181527 RepID=A0ACD3ANM1_9AGAR|nr:hypothetical protein BDN72DRAFT_859576 [Pluteus cervinus]
MDHPHQQQQHLYQHHQHPSTSYFTASNPSSAHSSPQVYATELDMYTPTNTSMGHGYMPTANPYPPSRPARIQQKSTSFSALQVSTSTSQSSSDQDASEPTARPSNAHVHAQFHSQSVPLPGPMQTSNSTSSTSSSMADGSSYQQRAESMAPGATNYAKSTPGLSRGLGRPLTPEEEARLAHLDRLKYFLATAPSRWDQAASASSSSLAPGPSMDGSPNSMDTLSLSLAGPQSNHSQAPPHPCLNRFLLPSQEYVTCVLWNGLYHITGTDIVRALVFRFEAFGRPVKNMKKFEEGVFSDLRNLKPGIDATLEDPKSQFLDLLFKYQCIRTQKKQKVFYWFSVPHDRLFLDALERDLKREKMGLEPTTHILGEPAESFTYDPKRSLYEQFSKAAGKNEGEGEFEAAVRRAIEEGGGNPDLSGMDGTNSGAGTEDSEGISDVDDSMGMNVNPATGMEEDTKRPTGPSANVLSMFTLFEGSPTYKQRRKKSAKVPSGLSASSLPRKDSLDDPRGRYLERGRGYPSDRLSHSVSVSRERMLGLPGGLVDEFGNAISHHGDGLNAVDMFLKQARGELNPADRVDVKPRPQSSLGEVSGYYAEPMSYGNGMIAHQIQRTRSHDDLHRHTYPASANSMSSGYTTTTLTQAGGSFDGPGSAGVGKMKVYVCSLMSCGRMFKRMEHLKRHLRTHTMERPYTCPHCAKRFSRSDNLSQHVRTHIRPDGTPMSLATRWDDHAMDADAGIDGGDESTGSVSEDADDDDLQAYAHGGMYGPHHQNGEGIGLGLTGANFHLANSGYPGNVDVQMCEVEVHGGEVTEVHGDEEGLIMRTSGPGMAPVAGGSGGYYSAPATTTNASFATAATNNNGMEYGNETQWATVRHGSPAFSNVSVPSPPIGNIALRSNRPSLTGPPPGYMRPSSSSHSTHSNSSSTASSVYGDDYATSMSAPSHKQAFDHAALYNASVIESAAGAVRRHRSMTPSVAREPRRPMTATSAEFGHMVHGNPANTNVGGGRAYHPYAYGHSSASHSRANSAQSSPSVYPIPLSGEYPAPHPHARRSESRNSSLGSGLQEQMMMNMSLNSNESGNGGEVYGHQNAGPNSSNSTAAAAGGGPNVYGEEIYRTESPAPFPSQTASPAPYTTELPAHYTSDGYTTQSQQQQYNKSSPPYAMGNTTTAVQHQHQSHHQYGQGVDTSYYHQPQHVTL